MHLSSIPKGDNCISSGLFVWLECVVMVGAGLERSPACAVCNLRPALICAITLDCNSRSSSVGGPSFFMYAPLLGQRGDSF